MPEAAPVCGIVLAAGGSSRMGRPKQLLDVAGKPMLQHVVDAAAGSCLAETVVVLGQAAEAIERAVVWPGGVRPVRVKTGGGLADSLRAGLAATRRDAAAAAILLGDQPQVTSDLIDWMVSRFRLSGAPCVRPVYSGAAGPVPGHPVVIARSLWPELERLQGDRGAGRLLAEHPEWVRCETIEGEPPIDVDRPEDYERLRRKWR